MRGLEALIDLENEYQSCTQCGLCESRNNLVFGDGSASADLMIIGEVPGPAEDEAGQAFQGEPGRLLMDLIAINWPDQEVIRPIRDIRDDDNYFTQLREYLNEHIFWTNAVLCHSPNTRSPTPAELKACLNRLQRTIYAVDPLLIIATGKVVASLLSRKKQNISAKRGELFDISIPSPATGSLIRYPMFAILHPGYLKKIGDQNLMSRKQGETFATSNDLRYAFSLLNEQYQDLFGTTYPERPDGYRKHTSP